MEEKKYHYTISVNRVPYGAQFDVACEHSSADGLYSHIQMWGVWDVDDNEWYPASAVACIRPFEPMEVVLNV